MDIDYSTWSKQELFDEAFRLLNYVQELLISLRAKHEAAARSMGSINR